MYAVYQEVTNFIDFFKAIFKDFMIFAITWFGGYVLYDLEISVVIL